MKQYSFLIEKDINFTAGSLSANFDTLKNIKEPWTRLKPETFKQIHRSDRNKAAQEIMKYKKHHLRKREWMRQLRKVDDKIQKNLKKHS